MKYLRELPKCSIHKEQMILRKNWTPEQNYCGVFYQCPKCLESVLLPSINILKERIEECKIDLNQEFGIKQKK